MFVSLITKGWEAFIADGAIRGNQGHYFANRVRELNDVQVVFTTRKLESCLPSVKSAFSNDLKSRVVYKLSCSGCTSTYVGQIVQHLTTRIEEHKKAHSPVGLHFQQCQLEGNSADLSWEIIDRSNNQTKLLTLEAIHIRKEKPGLNTSDEFSSRELTLKIYSQDIFGFLFKLYMSKSKL